LIDFILNGGEAENRLGKMKLHNINCIDIVAENIHGTDVVIHETQDRNVIAN
jgi:hypothetical protein